MTIEKAVPFFAWDVLTWLFLAMVLAIIIVLFDLVFLSKNRANSDARPAEKKSALARFFYFVCFLKFSKSETYNHRPIMVRWSIELFPVLLLVLVFRGFVFEPFRVPSNSMMPTLLTGDFILVNKFDYGLRLPISNLSDSRIFQTRKRGYCCFQISPIMKKILPTLVLTLLNELLPYRVTR